jgi:hypothetical protein
MRRWVEHLVKQWLTKRGYWVIQPGVPVLLISYGVATFEHSEGGGAFYHVHMPPGHKLWALNNTIVTAVEP